MNGQINNKRSTVQDLELELLQRNKNMAELQKENAQLQHLVEVLERTIQQEEEKQQGFSNQ